MRRTSAAGVVDFKDLPLHRPHPVGVAVAPLSLSFAATFVQAEAMVRPGYDNIRDYISPLAEAKGSGNSDLTTYGRLHLLTEELESQAPSDLPEIYFGNGFTSKDNSLDFVSCLLVGDWLDF